MPTVSSAGILEHEPGDLTCIVEAGLRLSALRAALAVHGQRLSLDPPGDPTLAECLLDDLSGPLSHRFGTMRDLVIGVTVVLPDGLRASSGGKVVKNVAGYDLAKLYCGSRGQFGTVERLALRLHPLPAVARTTVLDADWPSLHHSQLAPSAVDIADGRMHVLFEGGRNADIQIDLGRHLDRNGGRLIHSAGPFWRTLDGDVVGGHKLAIRAILRHLRDRRSPGESTR